MTDPEPIDPKKLRPGPIRNESLPPEMPEPPGEQARQALFFGFRCYRCWRLADKNKKQSLTNFLPNRRAGVEGRRLHRRRQRHVSRKTA